MLYSVLSGGPNLSEKATACMELVLWKVKEDLKGKMKSLCPRISWISTLLIQWLLWPPQLAVDDGQECMRFRDGFKEKGGGKVLLRLIYYILKVKLPWWFLKLWLDGVGKDEVGWNFWLTFVGSVQITVEDSLWLKQRVHDFHKGGFSGYLHFFFCLNT